MTTPMTTLEIPRDEWPQFFRRFTALHEGWRCSIEILGESLGAQIQSSGMPLTDIDVAPSKVPQITVALGGKPDAHLTHVIDAPARVRLLQAVAGQDEVLEIEGTDLRTLLRFQKEQATPRAPS